MTAILDHLDQASVFGRSSVALFLILSLDRAFSAVHAYWCCRRSGHGGRSRPPGGALLGFDGNRFLSGPGTSTVFIEELNIVRPILVRNSRWRFRRCVRV
jgi:hypothetical protein